jgi:uncharacterized membrane protein
VPTRRWVSLGLVLLAAVPWSMALTVVGLWAAFSRPSRGLLSDPVTALAVGCSAVACGQLVFMVCVSDRVFPRATRRITVPAEAAMAIVFIAGLMVGCGSVLIRGGGA